VTGIKSRTILVNELRISSWATSGCPLCATSSDDEIVVSLVYPCHKSGFDFVDRANRKSTLIRCANGVHAAPSAREARILAAGCHPAGTGLSAAVASSSKARACCCRSCISSKYERSSNSLFRCVMKGDRRSTIRFSGCPLPRQCNGMPRAEER